MMFENPALDHLLAMEWSAPDDTCPACGGVKPTLHDTGGEGHEHACEIAQAIASFSGQPIYMQPVAEITMSYDE